MKRSMKSKIGIAVLIVLVTVLSLPYVLVFGFKGTEALSKWQKQSELQKIAEEYVRNTYGNHYYVSDTKVSFFSYILTEKVSGITCSFSDKDKKETTFQVEVSDHDKSVVDRRYLSENQALYEGYVKEYVKNYISKYGWSEDEYSFHISSLSIKSDKPHILWKYENYHEMVSDDEAMNQMEVEFTLDISNTEMNFEKYELAYNLYRSLNQAKYGKSEFELSFHRGVQTFTYRGVYRNGKYDAGAVPDYANIEYVR